MDLSALIFVALAVAWATYLIPKALRHHEDSSASRTVEGFSGRLRVLARREPVDSSSARLVVPGKPARTAESSVPEVAEALTASTGAPGSEPRPEVEVDLEFWAERRPAARRAAAARAARRRLRVVLAILTVGVLVVGLAALGQLAWAWVAAPAGLLVAWLVACRLMVKRERATTATATATGTTAPNRRLPLPSVEPTPVVGDAEAQTGEIDAVEHRVEAPETPETAETPQASVDTAEPADAPAPSAGWDPVPVTLPTYVAKEPAARRSVRTIDLDATGVWTSGPLASDSALAREADAERKRAGGSTASSQAERERRASGS